MLRRRPAPRASGHYAATRPRGTLVGPHVGCSWPAHLLEEGAAWPIGRVDRRAASRHAAAAKVHRAQGRDRHPAPRPPGRPADGRHPEVVRPVLMDGRLAAAVAAVHPAAVGCHREGPRGHASRPHLLQADRGAALVAAVVRAPDHGPPHAEHPRHRSLASRTHRRDGRQPVGRGAIVWAGGYAGRYPDLPISVK
eukprot:261666-Heterocapsa_arctica.AAC.1